MKTNTYNMVCTALFAALLCVAAPFTIPVGPVPITLGTLIIYMAGGILGKKRATVAVAVYILLGTFGLPVFSGFTGGFGKLLGPTGGYIFGYLPLAYMSGMFINSEKISVRRCIPGMALGTVVLYAFGTAWYMLQTSAPFLSATALCVLPFLPGDAVKIAVSALCAPEILKRVPRLLS